MMKIPGFLLILDIFLQSSLANSLLPSIALTTGSIVEQQHGFTVITEEVLDVKITFTDIDNIIGNLYTLHSILPQLRGKLCHEPIIRLLYSVVDFLSNSTIPQEQLISQHDRGHKVQFFNNAFNSLRDIDSSVQISHLTNSIIDIVSSKNEDSSSNFQEIKLSLTNNTDSFKRLENSVHLFQSIQKRFSEGSKHCEKIGYLNFDLYELMFNIRNTLTDLHAFINNLVMASNNIVTSDLIPLPILTDIIQSYADKTGNTPIFPLAETYKFYPFITANILRNGVLLKLPIVAKRKFQRFSFTPFPTCVNNEPLILDSFTTDLLIDYHQLNYIETNVDVLNSCQTHFNMTLCFASQLPIIYQSESCLANLILNKDPSICSFKTYHGLFQAKRLTDHTVVFNALQEDFTMSCLNTGPLITSSCNILLKPSCTLRNEDIFIPSVTSTSRNRGHLPVMINSQSQLQSFLRIVDSMDSIFSVISLMSSISMTLVAFSCYCKYKKCFTFCTFTKNTTAHPRSTQSQLPQVNRLQLLHLA